MSTAAGRARTVLVTGANGGIGLAATLELARRGFDVVATVRSDAKAAYVRDHAAGAGCGDSVATALLDVNDLDALPGILDHGPFYGLVNNAGYTNLGAVEDVSDEDARAQIDTMVLAPMRLARLVLPAMRDAGEGRIVNVSSVYSFLSTPLSGWYQAAKRGLEGVSDALRFELAGSGVAVVSVQPGAVATDLWEEFRDRVQDRRDSRFARAYERAEALVRAGEPFMASADAVARTIGTAMTTRSPRPVYLVGVDARVARLSTQLVPQWVRDRVSRTVLGL